MNFDFSTAGRIIFGCGSLRQAGSLAAGLGKRALLVAGRGGADPALLLKLLDEAGIQCQVFQISGEPNLVTIQSGVEAGRTFGVDFLVGFGGGSALDAAKAIAALLTNPGEVLDYLEVVGFGRPLTVSPLPVLAIPTTAGTGSEVTRNAVISVPDKRFKVSLRHPAMLPRIALVDPELTLTLPPAVTASTGMDALTQVIEPYLSARANPFTDLYCVEGIRRAARSLVEAVENGSSLPARTDMAYASLLGGLSLANAGLGAVHGLAAPIGGMFPAPHGAVCACLLPLIFQLNLHKAQQEGNHPDLLERFNRVGQLLLGGPSAAAAEAEARLFELRQQLRIPPLSAYGVQVSDLAEIAAQGLKASSMKANPLLLNQDELIDLLHQALDY